MPALLALLSSTEQATTAVVDTLPTPVRAAKALLKKTDNDKYDAVPLGSTNRTDHFKLALPFHPRCCIPPITFPRQLLHQAGKSPGETQGKPAKPKNNWKSQHKLANLRKNPPFPFYPGFHGFFSSTVCGSSAKVWFCLWWGFPGDWKTLPFTLDENSCWASLPGQMDPNN